LVEPCDTIRRVRASAFALVLSLLPIGAAHAERLPITSIGTAEGLPGSHLTNVTRDSRGFLWFGTRDGVSRFDGLRFVNYGVEHGLSDPTVNEVIESRAGGHWIATNGGGVCRLPAAAAHPAYAGTRGTPARLFTCLRVADDSLANNVNTLHEDEDRRLWAGTDGGLFVLDLASNPQRFEAVLLPRTRGGPSSSPVSDIISDGARGLWIASRHGLVHRAPDGTFLHYGAEAQSAVGGETMTRLLLDSKGRLWMGLYGGLLVMRPDLTRPPDAATLQRAFSRTPPPTRSAEDARAGYAVELPDEPGEILRVPLDFPRPLASVRALLESADGDIWIGTTDGLLHLAGNELRGYTTAEGLTATDVRGIAEDADGNLWFASTGAMKLTRHGFITYTAADGLGDPNTHAIYETKDGRLQVVSGDWIVNELAGSRFRSIRLPVPAGTIQHWGSPAAVLDHEDRWWVLGVQGLWHLPAWRKLEDLGRPFPPAMRPASSSSASSSPGTSSPHTSSSDAAFHPTAWLIEDSRRDIWTALLSRPARVLRWERATGHVRSFGRADGLPPEFPTVMIEDARGGIWVGFRSGGVARLRGNRFTSYGPAEKMATGLVTAMHTDARGRLWIGTNSGGLVRVDDLDAATPRFVHYTTAQGLGSNNVRCLTSDRNGRIYIGTARGVDRLDPDEGHVRHYTTLDGLAFGLPMTAYRDSQGRLWFGMSHGVSRLDPAPDPARTPPRVWIDALHVAGMVQPLSHLGVTEVPAITVGPNDNQLDVQFFGLTFAMGGTLRYQYRLEGADHEWSPATREQRVHYSALAPGSYRFFVRAVNADGAVSPQPATATFVVLPHVWQRTWFRLSIAGLIVLGATAVYRLRVARLIELERVRTRIASDLHDDIGSNLSRMAILSEVAKRQIGHANPEPARHLTEIADSARTLIDAMSDIVWSIDPRHDDLGSVIVRVREFAADVLTSTGVKWSCLAPPDLDRIRLRPDARRHLLLLLKEGVTNIARHAEAKTARLRVELEGGHLIAELSDDGCGFVVPDHADEPAPRARGGHGLPSMRWRAAELGGTLHTISAPGAGTHLRFTTPLRGPLGASHARAMANSPGVRQDHQS
jgi:signal transduction histidine kinase/ligand-binding sensor domain-containing protein